MMNTTNTMTEEQIIKALKKLNELWCRHNDYEILKMEIRKVKDESTN